RTESRVPHLSGGEIEAVGKDRPGPNSGGGRLPAQCRAGNEVEWKAGQRGEKAIEREDDPGGGCGIDSENLEFARDQDGIDRTHPCGRARPAKEWRAKAVPGGQRAGDAACLPAEAPVVSRGIQPVADQKRDDGQTQPEGDEKDEPGPHPKRRIPLRRLHLSFALSAHSAPANLESSVYQPPPTTCHPE